MFLEKTHQINIKITKNEKEIIENNAKKYKFATVSEYLRFVAVNAKIEVKAE